MGRWMDEWKDGFFLGGRFLADLDWVESGGTDIS